MPILHWITWSMDVYGTRRRLTTINWCSRIRFNNLFFNILDNLNTFSVIFRALLTIRFPIQLLSLRGILMSFETAVFHRSIEINVEYSRVSITAPSVQLCYRMIWKIVRLDFPFISSVVISLDLVVSPRFSISHAQKKGYFYRPFSVSNCLFVS